MAFNAESHRTFTNAFINSFEVNLKYIRKARKISA
jgi:hypothetical protein